MNTPDLVSAPTMRCFKFGDQFHAFALDLLQRPKVSTKLRGPHLPAALGESRKLPHQLICLFDSRPDQQARIMDRDEAAGLAHLWLPGDVALKRQGYSASIEAVPRRPLDRSPILADQVNLARG